MQRNDLGAMCAVGWHDETGMMEITEGWCKIDGGDIFEWCQNSLPIVTNTGHYIWSDEQVHHLSLCHETVEWSFNIHYQLFPVLCVWTNLCIDQTYLQ